MKTETFSGNAETAYGKTLPSKVPFSGSYSAYESFEEAAKANDLLSNDEHLTAINAKRKAKARAEVVEKALEAAGYAKPDPNSPEVITGNMVKSLMKLHNISEDVAKQILAAAQQAATAVSA